MTSWPVSSGQDAYRAFAYIFFRGVETPENSEDLQALIESRLISAALFLSQGELMLALEISDEDQLRAITSILGQVVLGRHQFTLISRSGNLAMIRAWSISDLVICVSLFESDSLDGSEIAARIVADNPSAAVDVVRRIGDEQAANGVLVQVTGRSRSEAMLQFSKAIAASRVTPLSFYFTLSPEEKARRSAARKPQGGNQGAESGVSADLPSLRRIAERRGVTLDEAIRAAGQTLDWIDSQVAEGGRFVLVSHRKRYRVRFPR